MQDLTPPGAYVAAPPDAAFSYIEMQDAIDEIYELRSMVIRIGLLGTLLYRPDPIRATPDNERQDMLSLLDSQVEGFDRVTQLMVRGHKHPDMTARMCEWVTACAKQKPQELELAKKVNELSKGILREIRAESDARSAILAEHMRVARAGYHSAISILCEHMWAIYEVSRSAQLTRARDAATSLQARLGRLERIGTHVRLVSLNASVEASRVGDAGRGLSIIAHEYKELAEEVGRITQDARKDVSAMQIEI